MYRPGSIHVHNEKDGIQAIRGLPDPWSVDLVVTQRLGKVALVNFMKWFQQQGTAVVVDNDDAMWCIDRENIAHRSWNGMAADNWAFCDRAAEIADLATVTTPFLAKRYGSHGRVEVLENCVLEEALHLPREKHEQHWGKVSIGWSGSTVTHPRDLLVVGDSMRRILDDYPNEAIARVVGDGFGAARDWGISYPHQMHDLGGRALGPDYLSGVSSLDIMLVPLQSSSFNSGKSFLKALEASSQGVPVIASPTPDNLKFGKTVPILFASTPQEWYDQIKFLVDNPKERANRGKAAREAVLRHWTYEKNAERWIAAWERAVDRRQKMMPKSFVKGKPQRVG